MQQFTPTGFQYQTTDAVNSLTGAPNTPVDIPPGAIQNWLLQMDSPATITGGKLGIRFLCDNLLAAPIFPDANAWLLRVLSVEPADVIAIGLSTGEPGVVDVPIGGAAAFAAAGINIDPGGPVTVRPEASFPTDLQMTVCETDTLGQCLTPATSVLDITVFARNQIRTFSVFVNSMGSEISFDPGFIRLFLRFTQG